MLLKDKILLEKLITKYTKNGVTTAINKLNESRKRLWCGVPEVYHIYNGDWETPEVEYDGCRCSEWDIQDSMAEYMKELIADGEDWGDPSNDKDFCRFCQAHAEQVQQDIIDFSECNESLSESDDSEQYMVNKQEFIKKIKRWLQLETDWDMEYDEEGRNPNYGKIDELIKYLEE